MNKEPAGEPRVSRQHMRAEESYHEKSGTQGERALASAYGGLAEESLGIGAKLNRHRSESFHRDVAETPAAEPVILKGMKTPGPSEHAP